MKRIWIAAVLVLIMAGLVWAGKQTNPTRGEDILTVINPELYSNDPSPLIIFPEESMTVEWVEHFSVVAGGKSNQIGLRADGVVVWRERE